MSSSAGYEWLLSPKCNLRGMARFASFTLHQGQSVFIPPYVVYHLEHILPSSKREKFEQCCVVLQCDYQTSANQFKNMISFQELNRDVGEGKGSNDLEQMKNEMELQRHVNSSNHQPNATFLRPQMNRPMKEEKEELENYYHQKQQQQEDPAPTAPTPSPSTSRITVKADVISIDESSEAPAVFSNAMSADDFLAFQQQSSEYSPVSELLTDYTTNQSPQTTHLTSFVSIR
jgi:hypothetical protein